MSSTRKMARCPGFWSVATILQMDIPIKLLQRRGSIHEVLKHSRRRDMVGTLHPTTPNLKVEMQHNT